MTGPGAPDADLRRRMSGLIGGYQRSAAVGAVARLGVPDALAAGPLDLAGLAARVDADPRSLERVLRALDDAGLFTRDAEGRVALTPLGDLLRGDVPGSARRAAIASTDEWRWRAYGHLTHSVRTGEPGFDVAHGRGLWAYLASEPDAAAMFDESMSRVAAATAAALAGTCDLGGARLLVDVGGGHGVLARTVLAAHPGLRAVVLDLPGVVEGTRRHIAETGVEDRCEAVAGDFFTAVPEGGDVYVLSWVLHDWDDAAAARILAVCRAAMAPGARLLVVEIVLPGDADPPDPVLDHLVRATDLEMLVTVGGRERTADEYRALLTDAGFAVAGVTRLPGLPWSVIEAA